MQRVPPIVMLTELAAELVGTLIVGGLIGLGIIIILT